MSEQVACGRRLGSRSSLGTTRAIATRAARKTEIAVTDARRRLRELHTWPDSIRGCVFHRPETRGMTDFLYPIPIAPGLGVNGPQPTTPPRRGQ
jgi:hypothetical protein